MLYKFALKRGTSNKESKALHYASIINPSIYGLFYFNVHGDIPEDYIPFGTIDWVLSYFKKSPLPNYYPEFLSSIFNRKIWKQESWPLTLNESVFIKPADKPKRYNGKVTTPHSYKGKKKGPHWCSEIVKFENEWRLYIQNGKIIYSGWYYPEYGQEIDCPKAYIDIIQSMIPSGWCGSIDIGEANNKLALVEAGEPYSTGWYGTITEGKIYADWCIAGWNWMKENL